MKALPPIGTPMPIAFGVVIAFSPRYRETGVALNRLEVAVNAAAYQLERLRALDAFAQLIVCSGCHDGGDDAIDSLRVFRCKYSELGEALHFQALNEAANTMQKPVFYVSPARAHGLSIPRYATSGASGIDFPCDLTNHPDSYRDGDDKLKIVVYGGQSVVLDSGFKVKVPDGWDGNLRSRSGLNFKHEVHLSTPGTIDADFSGEMRLRLRNNSIARVVLCHGDIVAQLVLTPTMQADVRLVDEILNPHARGEQGFGSTDGQLNQFGIQLVPREWDMDGHSHSSLKQCDPGCVGWGKTVVLRDCRCGGVCDSTVPCPMAPKPFPLGWCLNQADEHYGLHGMDDACQMWRSFGEPAEDPKDAPTADPDDCSSQCPRTSARGNRCHKLDNEHTEHHNLMTGEKWSDVPPNAFGEW